MYVDSANAKVLEKLGLVSGAVFGDLDADGDADLVLALEWGPIKVLRNDAGKFTAATKELGLDMEQLNTCLESGAGSAAVAADVAEGDELGIHSTPSFFVNGHFLKNLPSEAGMEALIDRLAGVPTSP